MRTCSTVNSNFSTEVCHLLSWGLWSYFTCRMRKHCLREPSQTPQKQHCPTLSCFCFLMMMEEEVKEEERKCLHQCLASISPSVSGEDWSLPWLISCLIWQDMFDLMKTSGRTPALQDHSFFFSFNQELNYLPKLLLLILQVCHILGSLEHVRKKRTRVCITQDLAVNGGLIKSVCKNLLYTCHSLAKSPRRV